MNKLNNLILVIILLISFNSCVVTKKQRENFLAKHCERKDSISYVRKDSIVYKDSLIYIPQIINTPIYLENPCKVLCDSLGNLRPFIKTTTKGGLKSTVKSVGNSIVFECETDSLKARIQWLEHNLIISEKSHTENTVKITCELEHRNKFDGFTFWWFWITFTISSLVLLFKFSKSYFKF